MTWAIVLLVLALVLLVAEAHLPGAILGVLGIAALVGSGLLFRESGVDIPIPVIVGAALVIGVLIILAARKVRETYRESRVMTGWEELIGQVAEVREPLDPEGQVFVEGALWRARKMDAAPIGVGEKVKVQSVDKLTLLVSPASETAEAESAGTEKNE
jgi:membrane-bound serine protease (ClpP class)